jgi:hypothetical protein
MPSCCKIMRGSLFMAKKIHLDLLQYVLDHQKPDKNYFNRFFLLEARMMQELHYKKHNIVQAKIALIKSGLLGQTDAGLLHITDAGKAYLYEKNGYNFLTSTAEKIIIFLNRYKVVISLGGMVLGIFKIAPYIKTGVLYLVR